MRAVCSRQFFIQFSRSGSKCVTSEYNIITHNCFLSHVGIYRIRLFLYVCKQFRSRSKVIFRRSFFIQFSRSRSPCVTSQFNMIKYKSFLTHARIYRIFPFLYVYAIYVPFKGRLPQTIFYSIFFKVVPYVLHWNITLLRITDFCLMQVFTVYVRFYTCICNLFPFEGHLL